MNALSGPGVTFVPLLLITPRRTALQSDPPWVQVVTVPANVQPYLYVWLVRRVSAPTSFAIENSTLELLPLLALPHYHSLV
jgi:hypothetical protein